ncbi:hypothetical protein LZ30DRAFT_224335 [Colletotrichum cereale]|nr:hypothetical protein LZ30DRAFT_224335 [Colletotrichum cereale]
MAQPMQSPVPGATCLSILEPIRTAATCPLRACPIPSISAHSPTLRPAYWTRQKRSGCLIREQLHGREVKKGNAREGGGGGVPGPPAPPTCISILYSAAGPPFLSFPSLIANSRAYTMHFRCLSCQTGAGVDRSLLALQALATYKKKEDIQRSFRPVQEAQGISEGQRCMVAREDWAPRPPGRPFDHLPGSGCLMPQYQRRSTTNGRPRGGRMPDCPGTHAVHHGCESRLRKHQDIWIG